MGKNKATFGIYATSETLENGLQALREAGFRHTDVSVLRPENDGSKDLAHVKTTKAPEGATAGAISGAAVGGALGWLASIGIVTLPGIGPLIAAGPIVAALAGVGAGGTLGGIAGALVGFGVPEYEAKRYEGRVRKGGMLLSVHCDDSQWSKKAKQTLIATGAEDVASTDEAAADFAISDRPIPRRVVNG